MGFSPVGLAVGLAVLAGYDALWARYLVTGRAEATLYRPWRAVPVPMAVLPVVVFLATAACLGNAWIAVAAAVLAAGHIPAAALIARTLSARGAAGDPRGGRP
jgi:hypothetical protein